ncbi:MAG: hypothetical protein GXY20_07750 [Clostridiales bacterium]|nr:hypothetical protein [Clostridiales bacterium]
MRKHLALIAVLALLLSLFSACGSKPDTAAPDSTAAPTNQPAATPAASKTPDPAEEATPAPVDEGPYNYAVGKYEVDANGYPISTYEYELPLTTTDETFTYWTANFTPQYVPEEGYSAIDYYKGFKEYTGVNIEYIVVSYNTRGENFAALLASDDLPDIFSHGTYLYTSGTLDQAVDDGYYVNIYDYKDYCPNYMYYVVNYDKADERTKASVFFEPEMIVAFYALYDGYYTSIDLQARGDWLKDLGMTNDDIVTYDDVYDMLVAMKSQYDTCEYPYAPWYMIDGARSFVAYDTMAYITVYNTLSYYVVDNEIKMINIGENDKELMQMFNKWWADGLVDPNYAGYTQSSSCEAGILNGQIGFTIMHSSENEGYESRSVDADTQWVPIKKPLRYPGQVLHYNCWAARTSLGNISVSAKCPNIELAVTWLDWRYSPFGADYTAWGPEGIVWEYDENGEKTCTDWAMKNPDGIALTWVLKLFGFNVIVDGGIEIMKRNFAYPGGERYYDISTYWNDLNYDGAYDISPMFKLTTEEKNELAQYTTDIATYQSEMLPQFFDGSKPFSEWDSYVQTMYDQMDLGKVFDIYQTAYDNYLAGLG